ncbi:MAG: glycosyltransferase family 2 protein [Bacteroidales bacterium]|nr:glycosyltransferase family 2 protein [Bacteroidales bacterium]
MKISVVIPLYNKRNCIRETLNSVFNQSYTDFEVLVVDDGSTDESLEVVKEFKDERLRIIEKSNTGVSATRNVGIAAASNDWIAFLDADDVWTSFHLETLVKLHERFPEAEVLCSNYEKFSSNESYIDKLESLNQKMTCFIVKDYYERLLSGRHVIASSTALVKKDCLEKVGGFDQRLIKGEDLDCWAKLYESFTMAQTEFITAFYRLDPTDGNATKKVSSVNKYAVYYYKPQLWKSSYKSMFECKVIYNYLKHFLVYRQPKNFLLLLFKQNIRLLRILPYKSKAKKMGIKF